MRVMLGAIVLLVLFGCFFAQEPSESSNVAKPTPVDTVTAPPVPRSVERWKITGKQGVMTFVSMPADTERDSTDWNLAAAEACIAGSVCAAHFFDAAGSVPSQLPFTPEDLQSKLATYNRNTNTGLNRWLWNCGRFDDVPPDECMATP